MSLLLSSMPEIAYMCIWASCIVSIFYLQISKITESTTFASLLSFGLVTFAFFCLIILHVVDDFSIRNVYETSNLSKSLIYKILGSWGNYEGSMFLWVWVLNLYALLMSYFIPSEHDKIKKVAVAVQNVLYVLFGLFILIMANPFEKMDFFPSDGLGLNPMLQDIALGIHPPVLYLGYVGFSTVFSISIACAFLKLDQFEWEQQIHAWVRVSLCFLTVGIGLGSWWAYRELGWGGFWFWDPVENISLIPWLSGLILLHVSIITKKYGLLYRFAYSSAIITFCLSMAGALITRSGILASVHSFSVDRDRTICIFIIALCIGILGVYAMYLAFNQPKNPIISKSIFFLSNFFLILVNAILFGAMLSVVSIGTIYPPLLEFLTGNIVSVGAPYYNFMLGNIAIFAMLAMSVVFYSSWLKIELNISTFIFFVLSCFVFDFFYDYSDLVSSLILLGSIFIILASIRHIYFMLNRRLPVKLAGMILGHVGIAIFAIGAISSSLFYEEYNGSIQLGKSFSIAQFSVKLEDVAFAVNGEFESIKTKFKVTGLYNVKPVGVISSENRFYIVERAKHSEIGILHVGLSDLYIAIGEIDKKSKSIAVRAYYKPSMSSIWIGYIVCAVGFIISIIVGCYNRKSLFRASRKIYSRMTCLTIYIK